MNKMTKPEDIILGVVSALILFSISTVFLMGVIGSPEACAAVFPTIAERQESVRYFLTYEIIAIVFLIIAAFFSNAKKKRVLKKLIIIILVVVAILTAIRLFMDLATAAYPCELSKNRVESGFNLIIKK